jgi:regulator of replication initiation timing
MNLREKINTLETERASLMVEIENLRKVAESRVDALESEVSTLRSEVKSLRDLLGYKEEEKQ